MTLGGAYQGKLDFAKETFGVTDADVFFCDCGQIDFSKRCICHLEVFAENHPDPTGYFENHRDDWQDSILILQDIFCGVVPMGAQNRAWRQRTGRLA